MKKSAKKIMAVLYIVRDLIGCAVVLRATCNCIFVTSLAFIHVCTMTSSCLRHGLLTTIERVWENSNVTD